jgi:hypothetical protein
MVWLALCANAYYQKGLFEQGIFDAWVFLRISELAL